MLHMFKKKSKATMNTVIFRAKGIVDATNFDAMSPDDSLGYMCGCDISVYEDGRIEIYSEDDKKELLENFFVLNVIAVNNNINNYCPMHTLEVSLMTESKDLRISFQNQEDKNGFWNAVSTVYNNLKQK